MLETVPGAAEGVLAFEAGELTEAFTWAAGTG